MKEEETHVLSMPNEPLFLLPVKHTSKTHVYISPEENIKTHPTCSGCSAQDPPGWGGVGGQLSLSKQLKGRFKEGSREVASFPLVDRLYFSAWCSLTIGTHVMPCFHGRAG